jgi:hypothetical protein
LILQELLCEHSTEEESMESLKESLTSLIDILEQQKQEIESDCSSARKDAVSFEMAVLPLPEPLNLQFAQRQLFTELPVICSVAGTEDEDRLSLSFWMPSHYQWMTADEVDSQEPEHQVQCDLQEVAQSCLKDLDLARETEKLYKKHMEPARLVGWAGTTTALLADSNSNGTNELHHHPQPGRAILSTARDIKTSKPYVAPMRGRGFGRGGINSRNDPFRSRAPNTSRPPSLHVDDFVAMEKNGSSASGSTTSSGGVFGNKTIRGGGGTGAGRGNGGSGRTGRGGGFTNNNDRGRFNFPQQPRREATRTRPVGNNGGGSASLSSGKWGDDLSYNNSSVAALALATSQRGFQSTNRVWTNSSSSSNTGNNSTGKERYTSPSNSSGASSSSSVGRTRHSRTFSR